MKYVVTVPEDVARISCTYLPIKAAISFFMDAFDQAPLILSKMQDQISLTLCWRSVDALLTLIFQMWLGAWVSVFCTSRRLIRRKWTVTYLCQYFTISSSISECDHKCETRNAEPEIGPDGSSQTRRNSQVDGYGPWFGLPRVSRSGSWPGLEPNRPSLVVQSRTAGGLPGPVANTICYWPKGAQIQSIECQSSRGSSKSGLEHAEWNIKMTIECMTQQQSLRQFYQCAEAPGRGRKQPTDV